VNCRELISNLGFQCREVGGGALRVLSPFTYANDGEHIGLYIQEIPTGYLITDACESLMHSASMGLALTPTRLEAIRRSMGFAASLSESGEIATTVPPDGIARGIAAVLNGSLAVSHHEAQWKPRFRAESFNSQVTTVLEGQLAGRVLQKVNVRGASGHQLELPLAVRLPRELVYVQPVALDDDAKVDWRNVYLAYGRMIDLKNAAPEDSTRLVVVEDAANDPEMKNAVRLLSEASSLVMFSRLAEWASKRAA
jgi:hypothetical protein